MRSLCAAVLALAACGKSSNTPADATAAADGPAADASAPAAPSIGEQLAAAEAAGPIDHDTFLLYSLYAATDPSLLPAPYAIADDETLPEGTLAGLEAQRRLPQMTADMQAKFAPLFARPTDATSVLGHSHDGLRELTWSRVVDDADKIVFWYSDVSYGGFVEAVAEHIEAVGVMADYTTVMGISECGDGAPASGSSTDPAEAYLDIYFSTNHYDAPHRRSTDSEGETFAAPENNRIVASPCQAPFVIIPIVANPSTPPVADAELLTAVRHEIFHTFQLSRKYNADAAQNSWLTESSAAWASDRATHAGRYLIQNPPAAPGSPWSGHPDHGVGPLDASGNLHEQYRTAIFWGYAFDIYGQAASSLGTIFAAAGDTPSLQTVPGAMDFGDVFSKFVLRTWDRDPVGVLELDGMPTGIATQVDTLSVSDPNPLELDVSDLKHVSGRFFDVAVSGNVKQLEVDLDDIGTYRRARGFMVLADGTKKEFDWGISGTQKYCLDRPAEDVQRLLIAVTDYDTDTSDPMPPGKIHLKPIAACAQQPSTLSYNSTTNVALAPLFSFSSGSGSATATYGMMADLVVTYNSQLVSASEIDYLYDVTGTNHLSLTSNAAANFVEEVSGTFAQSWQGMQSASGSGVCHTPTAAGESTFGLGPAVTGKLYIKVKASGPASWELEYDMVGVPVSVSYSSTAKKACADPMGATDTTTRTWNAGAMSIHVSEENNCTGEDSSNYDESPEAHAHLPWTHGNVEPLFDGTMDPASGTISATSSETLSACSAIPFAAEPELFGYGSDSSAAGGSPTCMFSANGGLHISLGGPLARPM